jgi:hypothetical protein
MKSAAQVRAQVEATLGAKARSPFSRRESSAPEMVAIGLAAVDALTGGVPRSSLTEISGPPSSGRTALELALLASLTAKGEACALIDAEDSLDPVSAQAAGVKLERLLWVRCGGLGQALRATDLLLGAGGFGAVVLDLAGIPARWARRVPLSYWFRFRRAVESTPTVLMLVDEEPCAQSSASLVLRLEAERALWSAATENRDLRDEIRNSKIEIRKSVVAGIVPDATSIKPLHPASKPLYQGDLLPHAHLLRGLRWRAEVVRNRNSKLENRNSKLEARDYETSAENAFRFSLFEFRVSK